MDLRAVLRSGFIICKGWRYNHYHPPSSLLRRLGPYSSACQCRVLTTCNKSSSSPSSHDGEGKKTKKRGMPPTALMGQPEGASFEYKKHSPNDPARLTCTSCGFIVYDNPRIVTGAVATTTDPTTGKELFLLCKRNIPPRKGYWNLPAGYLERDETISEGATRETQEEAHAHIRPNGVLSFYDIKHIGQVHVYFRAHLTSPKFSAGPESMEVKLFPFEDIPFDHLAFPTVSWALYHHKLATEAYATLQQLSHTTGSGGAPLPLPALPPYTNPILIGHEGSVHVWWSPGKGLYHDSSWRKKG